MPSAANCPDAIDFSVQRASFWGTCDANVRAIYLVGGVDVVTRFLAGHYGLLWRARWGRRLGVLVYTYKCIDHSANRTEDFARYHHSILSLLTILLITTHHYSLPTTFSVTMHSTSFIAFLAALPATFACLAETTLPASTGSQSLSEPQYIASGETFDGEYVKVGFFCIQPWS